MTFLRKKKVNLTNKIMKVIKKSNKPKFGVKSLSSQNKIFRHYNLKGNNL